MKPITITLDPPITERCRDCGFESSYSLFSNRVTCPNCGKNSVSRVGGPKKDYVWVMRNKGRYDLLHPENYEYGYTFYNLPDGMKRGFVVEDEIETGDALECAEELKAAIDKYLYNRSKPEIAAVVNYLRENQEDQDEKRIRYRIESAKRELYCALYKGGQV